MTNGVLSLSMGMRQRNGNFALLSSLKWGLTTWLYHKIKCWLWILLPQPS